MFSLKICIKKFTIITFIVSIDKLMLPLCCWICYFSCINTTDIDDIEDLVHIVWKRLIDVPRPLHNDVVKWKRFPRYWPFKRGINRSAVNSPHRSQWRGALMFSLICARIKGWVNNRKAGDLRRHRAHYDVIVMLWKYTPFFIFGGWKIKQHIHVKRPSDILPVVPFLSYINTPSEFITQNVRANSELSPWSNYPPPNLGQNPRFF